MARVVFTSNLRRHVDCPDTNAAGATVRAVLDSVFLQHDHLGSYVVDEHGRLRKHMAIFVDGAPLKDRDGLTDKVADDSEIYVMQALSGG